MPVRFSPDGQWYRCESGETILQVAERAGVDLERVCGGRGTCGKCRVIVTDGIVSAITDTERASLTNQEQSQGYRLACQVLLAADEAVTVQVPEEARRGQVQVLATGIGSDQPLDPWVTTHHLTVAPAGLDDQTADLDAVERAWQDSQTEPLDLTLRALRQLPAALRSDDGRITLIRSDQKVISVSPGHTVAPVLGLACDIGTTTVVGYLMNLATGEELAVASELNPQTRHGDNVISRVQFADETAQGLATLQSEIAGALNRILAETTARAGHTPEDVSAMVIVGNTTMQHLVLGISPAYLAQSPYVPGYTSAQQVRACELGLLCHPDACVWLLPNIAGWVGADTLAVILSTGIHEEDQPALAIDIGTNGEMAMGSRERLITCSTAAGPAFEGAHISSGMRAADGALDQLVFDQDVHWHALGNGAPRGICGSGLVDAVSEMVRTGVIDGQGRLQSPEVLAANGHPALARRVSGEGRQRSFELVTAEEGANGHAVRLTQRDIRELQLAKGAVRAGIEILLQELGIQKEAIRKVFLAGAFGNYISPTSALGIGLLPEFPHAALIPVGNAAGSGARMALLSRSLRDKGSQILQHVEYLELSARQDFQDRFVEAMLFHR
ncbi:MAG: ASKHA domain-containing protein [Anaerolineae bacterium]|jgi:uncharacterized 2Fe-2S/4Fe-4S cluster protein (DUF4445 family)|nr:DUF4445 domain-containing protein [Chloroflexota bacterium]